MDERIFDEAEKEARRARWWRRGGIVWGLVTLGVFVGLVVWVFVDKHYRDRCGAHQVFASTDVRAISMLAHHHLDQGAELPPTILAYFDDPAWETSGGLAATRKPCGRFDADEIRIGRYSMADVLERRVRQSEIIREASPRSAMKTPGKAIGRLDFFEMRMPGRVNARSSYSG